MEDLEVERITPEEAGKVLHVSAEKIRAILRQGKVDWGVAVLGENGTYYYLIIKNKFLEWVGVKEVI